MSPNELRAAVVRKYRVSMELEDYEHANAYRDVLDMMGCPRCGTPGNPQHIEGYLACICCEHILNLDRFETVPAFQATAAFYAPVEVTP